MTAWQPEAPAAKLSNLISLNSQYKFGHDDGNTLFGGFGNPSGKLQNPSSNIQKSSKLHETFKF
jgi:hypothetical protein